jgi:broad specificity phosphatase PhoE
MHDKVIYLLRHGETGLKDVYVGSSDVSLSAHGREELVGTCKKLSTVPFDTILCSPMKRCIQTVAEISTQCRVEVYDFLKEIDFGRWEKKTFTEIVKSDSKLVDAWAGQPETFCFPEGESLPHFHERIATAADTLYKLPGKTVLVVSHGGVIRHLLCQLLKISAKHYLLFDVMPGCYATVRLHSKGGVLTGLNHKG